MYLSEQFNLLKNLKEKALYKIYSSLPDFDFLNTMWSHSWKGNKNENFYYLFCDYYVSIYDKRS